MADRAWMEENRYRAVLEVRDGSPVTEVASRYGVSRQSVHTWCRHYEQQGLEGLQERSRRPRSSPTRLAADVEALICELRRKNPRWGARRIVFEVGQHGMDLVPPRATTHRVLVRNGLVQAQGQEHKRKYRRWQRDAPMALWQMDIMGVVFLAGGRECKLVTGIDDHSRFIVVHVVVAQPTGRAVCEAFTASMHRYGVPSEVLTDNGKQFTGRFTKPRPAEVMFERVCRENGIIARLTKPRSPTTTGRTERFHKTLRTELLDHVEPFESLEAAQQAIDAWVLTYNHQRPHQPCRWLPRPARSGRPARTPPYGSTAAVTSGRPNPPGDATPAADLPGPLPIIEAPPAPMPSPGAVEFELLMPAGGATMIASTGQTLQLGKAWAGRTVTVWADQRTLHVSLDGQHLRSFTSRLSQDHLRWLLMKGGRPAGPEPSTPALSRVGGHRVVPTGQAVELERNVRRDGFVMLLKRLHLIGREYAYQQITLRLDGHLMHAIGNGALIGTWPCPVTVNQLAELRGVHATSTPVPPPALPAGSVRVQRRIGSNGRVMVGTQRLYIGKVHAGKTITAVIEDTHFRALHGDEELRVVPRTTSEPITKIKVYARHAGPPTKTLSSNS